MQSDQWWWVPKILLCQTFQWFIVSTLLIFIQSRLKVFPYHQLWTWGFSSTHRKAVWPLIFLGQKSVLVAQILPQLPSFSDKPLCRTRLCSTRWIAWSFLKLYFFRQLKSLNSREALMSSAVTQLDAGLWLKTKHRLDGSLKKSPKTPLSAIKTLNYSKIITFLKILIALIEHNVLHVL